MRRLIALLVVLALQAPKADACQPGHPCGDIDEGEAAVTIGLVTIGTAVTTLATLTSIVGNATAVVGKRRPHPLWTLGGYLSGALSIVWGAVAIGGGIHAGNLDASVPDADFFAFFAAASIAIGALGVLTARSSQPASKEKTKVTISPSLFQLPGAPTPGLGLTATLVGWP